MTQVYRTNRRSLLKAGALAGTALAAGTSGAFAQLAESSRPTKGDVAILRFLSAVEQIESDLWQQYNELGGIQDSEENSGSGSLKYTAALKNLDGDMPQYIHDNTDDEFSHHAFLNAYLQFIRADQVDLSKFATIPGSQATGAAKTTSGSPVLRLTNLMRLTVDTSWWTRYRSRDKNPDLDPSFFPPAVPTLSTGEHPAIPRSDLDLTPDDHIQAIANTAAFHFAFIEQGGTSLYPTLALKVTDPVVLRILLSIGPTETMHFQTWSDKAGTAVLSKTAGGLAPLTDGTLMFPDLNSPPFPSGFGLEDFQTNLIMPEPCPFLTNLNRKFPAVSIIRPTSTGNSGAVAAVNALTADGLFKGQNNNQFFKVLRDLAEDADEATRQC
jgi:hypothetical protein